MARVLTEKQSRFIDVLFDEAGGDPVQAKVLAGYSAQNSTTEIVKALKEEILEATQLYMARNAPKAAMAIQNVISNPTELGNKEVLAASKEFLDRTGLVKTEKLEVKASGGVMLLPAKNHDTEDE